MQLKSHKSIMEEEKKKKERKRLFATCFIDHKSTEMLPTRTGLSPLLPSHLDLYFPCPGLNCYNNYQEQPAPSIFVNDANI